MFRRFALFSDGTLGSNSLSVESNTDSSLFFFFFEEASSIEPEAIVRLRFDFSLSACTTDSVLVLVTHGLDGFRVSLLKVTLDGEK
jgi:hypothetical protein